MDKEIKYENYVKRNSLIKIDDYENTILNEQRN